MNKIDATDIFGKAYKALTETNRKNFARIINKLLNETFIIRNKDRDYNDYYFISDNKSLFEAYLVLIDYELSIDRINEIIYIKTTENRNREKMNLFDTVLILVFRMLYYKKKKEVSYEEQVIIPLYEIKEQVVASKVLKADSKNQYSVSLQKFRKYKIIDFVATEIKETTNIKIYPSIQVIVPQDKLEDIVAKLSALKSITDEENEDEDSDED